MWNKIKPALTVVLLLFVGVSLVVQVAKKFESVEPLQLSEGLNVVCTHATQRCPTCLTMERLTKELLESNFTDRLKAGNIVFRAVNYEHPDANYFSDEFRVATASVILVHIRGGEKIAGLNLANEAWRLHTDGPKFKAMLKENIDAILCGKRIENADSSDEIEIPEGEEIRISL